MNRYAARTELIQLNNSLNYIDSQLIKIKAVYHNLEKLGYKVDEFYRMVDDIEFPFYRLKTSSRDFIKEQVKNISKED